jgi:Na+/H+ antiporter NhaD/arsenite permease-like protein
MVLIRPLLRANKIRQHKAHILIFFTFIVCNIGGLLTPLGDPPLFLGFLKGVPFTWTFRLWPQWLLANGILLALFYVYDNVIFRREDIATPGDLDEDVIKARVPIHVVGKRNFLFLAGVVAVIYLSGVTTEALNRALAARGVTGEFAQELCAKGLQCLGMLLMAALSLKYTPKTYHKENSFAWGPIVEVAVLFAGIFLTMIPAIQLLNYLGPRLPVKEPWHFFWASGALSSFLDNTPTYITYAATAAGSKGIPAVGLYLSEYLARPGAAEILAAISCGAVFMGANTYIGNAPNFMVKAIAEENKVKMPSFFGYMGYSLAILIPLFVLITLIFFR